MAILKQIQVIFKRKKLKSLIIGGGFAGCAASHVLSLKDNWDITIIEKSSSLGAGVRTHWYGGHPYTFGPRHFLTKNEKVFEFKQVLSFKTMVIIYSTHMLKMI